MVTSQEKIVDTLDWKYINFPLYFDTQALKYYFYENDKLLWGSPEGAD